MLYTNEQHKKDTGAFYTPKIWADLAVKYMQDFFGEGIFDFTFYDCAAGEGNLIDALPKGTKTICSTLEWKDVEILRDKGHQAFQLDFIEEFPVWFTDYINNINNLVVFMNPPYFKLKAEHKAYGKDRYKTNDSVEIFYHRIINEMNADFIFSFNKLDLIQSSKACSFRDKTNGKLTLLKCFVSPSKSWGLKGNFPIGFFMYMILK